MKLSEVSQLHYQYLCARLPYIRASTVRIKHPFQSEIAIFFLLSSVIAEPDGKNENE